MLGHWSVWSHSTGLLCLLQPGSPCRRLDAIFEYCRLMNEFLRQGASQGTPLQENECSCARKKHIQQNMAGLGGTHSPAGRAGSTQWDESRQVQGGTRHSAALQRITASWNILSRKGPTRIISVQLLTLHRTTWVETYPFLCCSPWQRELIHDFDFPKLDAPIRMMLAISHAARCLFSFLLNGPLHCSFLLNTHISMSFLWRPELSWGGRCTKHSYTFPVTSRILFSSRHLPSNRSKSEKVK